MVDQQSQAKNPKPKAHSGPAKGNEDSLKDGKLSTFIKKLQNKAHNINWQMWGVIVSTLGLIVAVVFGFLGLSRKLADVKDTVKEVKGHVQNVEKLSLAREFIITSPADGTDVNMTDLVRGKTPFPEMNHYVIVTPLDVGDDWVQDNPVKVHASGTWIGRARFGASGTVAPEKFIVRCLATKSIVTSGPLTVIPEDAVFSEPVTVLRKQ